MAKLKTRDEVLQKLGIDTAKKATIAYGMWRPWSPEAEHESDPQGFKGIYAGYKNAEKQLADKISEFDVFMFDRCNPTPAVGTGFAVTSSFQLEELKRVEPGTEIVIVYCGSEKNVHGGNTHDVEWYFVNPEEIKTRVSQIALPATNADAQIARQLPANGQVASSARVPF